MIDALTEFKDQFRVLTGWSFAQHIWNADVVLSKCSMLGQDSTLSSLDYRAEVPVQVHCLWRKMWSHRMWSWKTGENWKAECSSRTLVNKLFTPAALWGSHHLGPGWSKPFLGGGVLRPHHARNYPVPYLPSLLLCRILAWTTGPLDHQQLPTSQDLQVLSSSIKFYDPWTVKQSKLVCWCPLIPLSPDESTALVISRPKSGFLASLASLGSQS